jgi:hypothetical protein
VAVKAGRTAAEERWPVSPGHGGECRGLKSLKPRRYACPYASMGLENRFGGSIVSAIAITTIARNLDHSFRDWCSYHLLLVERVYVWLDDPGEAHSTHLPSDSRVQIRVGSQYRKGSVHGDFMVRQDQNTNRSIELCIKDRFAWLIHLDTDELLYPADPETLRRNLSASAGHIILLNHEVCPCWHCGSPFRDCNYFKLNGRSRFNLYTNGKAAVRCQPGVYARDAHSFGGYKGSAQTAQGSVVLHYACPSYEHWVAKYAALGDFPDFWWDNPQHRIAISFHIESRDIVKQCLRTGDFQPAVNFWSSQVVDRAELILLQEKGRIGWFAPMQSI